MNFRKGTSKLGCWVVLLAAEIVGWITALPAVAAPTYIAIPLGTFVGGTRGLGINASGQVTGESYFNRDAHRAFLYSGGTMQDLGTLGGAYSSGAGINDGGQVVGYANTAEGAIHAFRFSGGTMQDLGTLGGSDSLGFGINNDGHAVGYANTSADGNHAFRHSGGTLQDLGTLGGQNSSGKGINASGQVTGWSGTPGGGGNVHAFRYSGDTMQDLGTLGGPYSAGLGINASGQVAGEAAINAGGWFHAFRYSGGTMQDLGTLDGLTSSSGQGINGNGDVVGFSGIAAGGVPHAFLYTDGTMYDLNSLVVSGLGTATLVSATAINDLGQIVANTCHNVPKECSSFRLDPISNYSGIWWNAPAGSESGWGINFAHQGDVIFATWFTYDAAGQAWWLSMTANKNRDGTYSGALYQTSGPAFNAIPFGPDQVTRTPVGSGTLTFSSASSGTFGYSVNGIAQTKSIVPQVFGPLPTCIWGAQSDLTKATNFQDLWWAAPASSESGWGINLTQQGATIFATWFTYDVSRNPLWYSVTAPQTGPNTFTGTLYRTTGPAFSADPFNPNLVQRTPIGTAMLTFTNGNAGTLAYQVADGANVGSQTKAITRQVFQGPGTVCH